MNHGMQMREQQQMLCSALQVSVFAVFWSSVFTAQDTTAASLKLTLSRA